MARIGIAEGYNIRDVCTSGCLMSMMAIYERDTNTEPFMSMIYGKDTNNHLTIIWRLACSLYHKGAFLHLYNKSFELRDIRMVTAECLKQKRHLHAMP